MPISGCGQHDCETAGHCQEQHADEVAAIPNGSENGSGCLSEYSPIIGRRIEAVSWKVSVMMPMWTKSSASGP